MRATAAEPTRSVDSINTVSNLSLFSLVQNVKLNLFSPWRSVRKRTVPAERPPLFAEVSANFYG
jgi:hypothetical protein